MSIRIVKNNNLSAADIKNLEGAPLFDPDYLDEAIIKVEDNLLGSHIAVYDYSKLVDLFAKNEFHEMEDPEFVAIEWVDYNLLQMIPYMGVRQPRIEHEGFDSDRSNWG